MAPKYTLTVQIDQRWVKEWGAKGSPMKLCYGSGMGSNSTANVVAFSSDVAASVTIEWLEEYQIAATKHSFQNGSNTTNYEPINLGEKLTVDRTWVASVPTPSDQAPNNGFLFQNVDTPASAVVAKSVNGKVTPIYISPFLLPPSGAQAGDKLYPSSSCAVWFSMDVESGTMVERDDSVRYVIEMDHVSKTVTYDQDGNWGTAVAS